MGDRLDAALARARALDASLPPSLGAQLAEAEAERARDFARDAHAHALHERRALDSHDVYRARALLAEAALIEARAAELDWEERHERERLAAMHYVKAPYFRTRYYERVAATNSL